MYGKEKWLRFCISLLHFEHRYFLRAHNMDHDSGPIEGKGGNHDSRSLLQ